MHCVQRALELCYLYLPNMEKQQCISFYRLISLYDVSLSDYWVYSHYSLNFMMIGASLRPIGKMN